MKKIFAILLMLLFYCSIFSQKKFNSIELTFAPGFNNLGLQYNRIVNHVTYQFLAESNLCNSYRSSICVGYCVGNDFYLTGGPALTFYKGDRKLSPEIGFILADKRGPLSISGIIDLTIGYARFGIGLFF